MRAAALRMFKSGRAALSDADPADQIPPNYVFALYSQQPISWSLFRPRPPTPVVFLTGTLRRDSPAARSGYDRSLLPCVKDIVLPSFHPLTVLAAY